MASSFSFLAPPDIDLLTELLDRRKPALLKRIRRSQAVSQMDADDIVSTIGEELVDNLADDWEPTDYRRDVSALLDRVNAARISEWP